MTGNNDQMTGNFCWKNKVIPMDPINEQKFSRGNRTNFLLATVKAGLQVALPIILLVVVFGLIINFMVGLLSPFKSLLGIESANGQWLINLIAFILLVSVFFLAGLFIRNKKGARFFSFIEKEYFTPLPMYSGIKDSVEQFMGKQQMPLRQVVSVNVFENDTRMIGFITDELDHGYYSIFVPTGPNPANGFIFVVKREQLEFLDVKPDAAMRMIIGVGTGASNLFSVKEEILDEHKQAK